MKWILLLVLVVGICTESLFAQKIRFTDTSNKWAMVNIDWGTLISTYPAQAHYTSDTILSGINYHHLISCDLYCSEYAIREDTIGGKLFFRYIKPNPVGDTIEYLFFDYSLKVGDTLRGIQGPQTVYAIDTVYIGAIAYKRWNLTNGSNNSFYDFIEGLGTTLGPCYSMHGPIFENANQLRCFTNKGSQLPVYPPLPLIAGNAIPVWSGMILPVNSFDNSSSCKYKTLGVLIQSGNSKITVIPNPGSSEISLNLPSEIHSANIRITDCTGRLVRQLITTSSKTNIGQYLSSSGLYYFLVQDLLTGQRYSGKFIFKP